MYVNKLGGKGKRGEKLHRRKTEEEVYVGERTKRSKGLEIRKGKEKERIFYLYLLILCDLRGLFFPHHNDLFPICFWSDFLIISTCNIYQ